VKERASTAAKYTGHYGEPVDLPDPLVPGARWDGDGGEDWRLCGVTAVGGMGEGMLIWAWEREERRDPNRDSGGT
jgi:hypothetical protein